MIHFFCPNCWKSISDRIIICRYCKYDLRNFNSLSYEDKLILSLKHPVKEIRRLIIFIIGLKKFKKAINEFSIMIEEEEDPVILMEIAKALRNINNNEAKKMLYKLKSHRFPIIARYVEQNYYHLN